MLKISVRPCVVLLPLFLLAFAACSNSLSDPDGGTENGGRLSTGEGRGAMFKSFDGCGIQIYNGSFTLSEDDGATCIYVGSLGWWGGAWGAYEDGVAIPDKSYDLSPVSKVSFDAKAISGSRAAADAVGTLEFAINAIGTFKAPLTTEWQSFSFSMSGASNATSQLFSLSGSDGLQKNGVVVFIKNIAFYNSAGKEILPELQNKPAVAEAVVIKNVQPFKSLDGCGYQIWHGNEEIAIDEEYMSVKVTDDEWWGGAWGAMDNGAFIKGKYYDVSKIAKITLSAKASKTGKLYFRIFGLETEEVGKERLLEVTTEWKDFELSGISVSENRNVLFSFGNNEGLDGAAGTMVYLKDVAFWDASGNEIIPELIEEW